VPEIPPQLARNAREAFGADGERWLANLPRLLAEVAAQWRLELGSPYELSFHWVTPVRREDGSAAVLKLGPPEPGHLHVEATTLRCFDGDGAVRLLEHDEARGALLMERADPGTLARQLVPRRDLIATAAIITVMRRLHRVPVPEADLPRLDERDAASFGQHLRAFPGDGRLPRPLVEQAAELHKELCATASRTALLHGDLHHDNVLRARREPWLAIDPHGVVGDPGYEVGAMLYNPDPQRRDAALLSLVPARIEQLADGLGMPVERVVAWGFVQGVLSEVWTVEGGGIPGGRALDVALLLRPRLP
jgi:streptomycin 6-kinase